MITESQIRKLAVEINEVSNFNPPLIPTQDLESLTEEIIDSFQYLLDTDIFSEEAEALMVALENGEKPVKETEDPTPEKLLDIVGKAKTIEELTDLCFTYGEFKILRGKLELFPDKEDFRDRMMETLYNLEMSKGRPIKKEEPKKESVPAEAKAPEVIKETKPAYIELNINPKFFSACPAITKDEFDRLEKLIASDGQIFNPILVWDKQIIDGHNRYEIAKRLNIPFPTKEISFDSEDDAILWIKENALGQRNLPEWVRFEMIKDIEGLLIKTGRMKKSEAGKKHSKNSTTDEATIESAEDFSTRKELSKKSGLSEAKIAKAKVVEKMADEETKEKLRSGETTINKEYETIAKQKVHADEVVDIAGKALRELTKWLVRYYENEFIKDHIVPIEDIIEKIRHSINNN